MFKVGGGSDRAASSAPPSQQPRLALQGADDHDRPGRDDDLPLADEIDVDPNGMGKYPPRARSRAPPQHDRLVCF